MIDAPLFVERAISADVRQKRQVTEGACDLIVILRIGQELTLSGSLIFRGITWDALIEPSSLNQEIRRASGHHLSVHFVIIGIQLIAGKAKFVKNAITEFGPFVDKDFGRISIDFQCLIPIREKMVGNGYKVAG